MRISKIVIFTFVALAQAFELFKGATNKKPVNISTTVEVPNPTNAIKEPIYRCFPVSILYRIEIFIIYVFCITTVVFVCSVLIAILFFAAYGKCTFLLHTFLPIASFVLFCAIFACYFTFFALKEIFLAFYLDYSRNENIVLRLNY